MIMKDLLKECPFDAMKLASIGILKELMMLYLGAEVRIPLLTFWTILMGRD